MLMEYEDEKLFDRVLVDAPCSGLGTLTKKPDLKWKKDLGDIRKIVNMQLRIAEERGIPFKAGRLYCLQYLYNRTRRKF